MTTHPAAAGLDLTAEIARHSSGLAAAAESHFDATVEHCPGWTVADLVAHVFEVHWFWRTVAEKRLREPPSEDTKPPRPADSQLLEQFRAGAQRLFDTLIHADQSAQVWTWAPSQRNIAFITRHQVQEAAVHHWDAVNAAGGSLTFNPALAVDAIEEFLTFSVASVTDHPETPRPSLNGTFALAATDVDAAWTVTDDELPGTIQFSRGAGTDLPTIAGSSSEFLLWLYGRVRLPGDDTELLARFRDLCFTD